MRGTIQKGPNFEGYNTERHLTLRGTIQKGTNFEGYNTERH